MAGLSRLGRLGIAIASGAGAAIVCVIALAVIDLYLTGHGRPSIMRETIIWEAAGVHMSPAGVVLFAVVIAAVLGAWKVSRPRAPRR